MLKALIEAQKKKEQRAYDTLKLSWDDKVNKIKHLLLYIDARADGILKFKLEIPTECEHNMRVTEPSLSTREPFYMKITGSIFSMKVTSNSNDFDKEFTNTTPELFLEGMAKHHYSLKTTGLIP